MDIYAQETTIRFADVDQSDTLTMASTFDLFQEAAINHAEILGVGREAMKQSGQVWILSRISVFMERRPPFGEKVAIRTWPRGANKLFAIRDYDIRSSRVDVRGRSGWLVVDLERHRPLRPQTAMDNLPANEGENALPGVNLQGNDPPPSLAVREFAPEQSVLRRVCYSDIDYNGHVNNTRYIQWIQDLIEPEILETAKQMRLDINYISEARYGETIKLYIQPINKNDSPENVLLRGQVPLPCKAAFAIEGRREAASSAEETVTVFRAELQTGK
ncbi:MAG: acyl-ACP thioesterase [Spirochaetaceae bacterium]|jgi:acyl-ACP thioesterase|nr:acyl-ACP thioesterase [Spirochaetaceae bacterium]